MAIICLQMPIPIQTPMENLIYEEILQLRKSCFNLFRTDIGFERHGSQSNNTFHFTLGNSEFLDPIPVGNDEHHRVLVQISNEKWCTLEKFLIASIPEAINMTAADGNTMLSQFWGHTGKHFRLLDLPAEIRNLVYKHALFPTDFDGRPYRLKPHTKIACATHKWRPNTEADFTPNAGLLRVSKQISSETLHLLYTDGEFHFTRPEDCNAFLMGISISSARLVRRLDLRFSHTGFLRFFGAKISSAMMFVHAPALEVIRAKIQDGHFEWVALHMPRPSGITDRRGLCDRDFPCPKRVVDWILASAFPWLEELGPAGLYLGGCVKVGQHRAFADKVWKNYEWRRGWEEFCVATNAEGGHEEANGGVSLRGYAAGTQHSCENEDENDGLDSLYGYTDPSARGVWVSGPIPPMCECHTTCSLTTFDRKD